MDGSKRLFLKTENGFSKIRNFFSPDIMGGNFSLILSKDSGAARLSQQQYDRKIPYNLDSFVEPLNKWAVAALHNMAMQSSPKG